MSPKLEDESSLNQPNSSTSTISLRLKDCSDTTPYHSSISEMARTGLQSALAMFSTLAVICLVVANDPVELSNTGVRTFGPITLRSSKCSNYCWVGKSRKVRDTIAKKCPGGRTRKCTRRSKTSGSNDIKHGVTCDCRSSATSAPTTTKKTKNFSSMNASCGKKITKSGGQSSVSKYNVEMGARSGTVSVEYCFYVIPDELIVKYEGKTLFSTGGMVTGTKTVTIRFNGKSSKLQMEVRSPNRGTLWGVKISCA